MRRYRKHSHTGIVLVVLLGVLCAGWAASAPSAQAQSGQKRLAGYVVLSGWEGDRGEKPLFLYLNFASGARQAAGSKIEGKVGLVVMRYLEQNFPWQSEWRFQDIGLGDFGSQTIVNLDRELKYKWGCCQDCYDMCYAWHFYIENEALQTLEPEPHTVRRRVAGNIVSDYYRQNMQPTRTTGGGGSPHTGSSEPPYGMLAFAGVVFVSTFLIFDALGMDMGLDVF